MQLNNNRGLLFWLSPDFATYVYNVFFKNRKIRILIQYIVKLFIPDKIKLHGVSLCLNKQDAIVSGALALGCYETKLLDLFVTLVKPGMCVVDVGANIGLYTIIASSKVGEDGVVIAIEPEANNCSYIHKSIRENELNNVKVYQQAISDKNGELDLYLCDLNNADHRIYDSQVGTTSANRKKIRISTSRLDDLIPVELHPKVDLLKIDIQGAEAIALEGMRSIFNANKKIKIILEYWPWGLMQSGSDPLGFLSKILDMGFKIYQIQSSNAELLHIDSIQNLSSKKLEREHFNLFLSK